MNINTRNFKPPRFIVLGVKELICKLRPYVSEWIINNTSYYHYDNNEYSLDEYFTRQSNKVIFYLISEVLEEMYLVKIKGYDHRYDYPTELKNQIKINGIDIQREFIESVNNERLINVLSNEVCLNIYNEYIVLENL